MISVIIPAYNNPQQVKKLLDSIRPEVVRDPNLEVIVVDDGSRGDSIRKVVEKSNFATYMKLRENRGPSAARNAGAKVARNNILLFLDSDVILNDDTLSRVKDKFNKDRSVSIFGGEYDIEPVNKTFPTRFKALMARSWVSKENNITLFVTRIGAIKKKVFNELGGFDESIKTASSEEWEFGRRLMDRGYTIYYDPAVTVRHHFPSFKKEIGLLFHRAFMWVYVFKKYRRFDNHCTTPLQSVSQICGFLAVIFLLAALINIAFIYLSLTFLALFILTNLRFFKLALKHDGLVFTLKSIPMALVLSCSIVLGGIWGVVYYFLYKGILKKN